MSVSNANIKTVGQSDMERLVRRNPLFVSSTTGMTKPSYEALVFGVEPEVLAVLNARASRLGYREFWKNATKTKPAPAPTPRIRMRVSYVEAVRGFRKLYPIIVDCDGNEHQSRRYVKIPYQLITDMDDQSRRELDAHQRTEGDVVMINVPCSFYDDLRPRTINEVQNNNDYKYLDKVNKELRQNQ